MSEKYNTTLAASPPQAATSTSEVVLCLCVYRTLIDRKKALHLASTLREAGYSVRIKADLCREVMLEQCTAGELSGRIVLACYPRAVRSLLQWKEADAKAYLDIRTGGAQEVLAAIMGTEAALTARTDAIAQPLTDAALLPPAADAVPEAWFPIIDKERCTECGKCHDFCLFGVYAKSADGRVCVVQPQSCKNNCPACARVCPSRAVIFPKYEKSPVNGGLTEEESFTPQEAERMYRERLRYKLQQRSGGVPLTKSSDTN